MKSRGATQVVPVLKSEPAIWPADLFQTADQPSPSGRWWALHTRPRAEKVLARRLYSQRISFFLPLEHKRLKKPGSPRYSCLPLFPGYVFLRGGEEQRLAALKTNVVIQCLEAADQDRLDSDLRSI